MLDKIFEKIKEIIDIKKFNDDDLMMKILILRACVIKDDKFYPKIFVEEALFVKTKFCCCLMNKTSN